MSRSRTGTCSTISASDSATEFKLEAKHLQTAYSAETFTQSSFELYFEAGRGTRPMTRLNKTASDTNRTENSRPAKTASPIFPIAVLAVSLTIHLQIGVCQPGLK